jgi:four helix bundle protein
VYPLGTLGSNPSLSAILIEDCRFEIADWVIVRVTATQMKARIQRFALAIIQCVGSLPLTECSRSLGRQLLRGGTSVGANYRACRRAKSRADFVAQMGIVREEPDEIAAMMVSSLKTAKSDDARQRQPR